MKKRHILFPPVAMGRGRRAALWFLRENYNVDPFFIALWFEMEVERVVAMAAKKQNKKGGFGGQSGNSSWRGFANINLTTADKEQIKSGVIDNDLMWDIILSLGVNGHKVTLTCDREKNQWIASATGQADDCPNLGFSLTAHATDPIKALTVLCYKHEFIAKGEWDSQKPDAEDDFG